MPSNPSANKKVLHSTLAGSWYPADPVTLKKELAQYLAQAKSPATGSVGALILPHAGYVYSGGVAASGIARVAGRNFSRVVVMGPTHSYAMQNIVSVPDATHYATPLGETALDLAFINRLKASPWFTTLNQAHTSEHSVQIQLPLLQVALGEFKLVPLIVGQLTFQAARDIARVLLAEIDNETLVVVSSDFCHYGARFNYLPFTDNIPEQLRALDLEAFDLISRCDPEGFFAYLKRTGNTICGKYPIAVLLAMAAGQFDVELVKYDTSGNMGGDYSASVSYLSLLFSGSWEQPGSSSPRTGTLDTQSQTLLLTLARQTLAYYLRTGSRPELSQLGITATPAMQQIHGGFVTLHQKGQLRGCIGEISPSRPLYQVVMDHAVNAAVRDPRFPPVTAPELPGLQIEISALTPPVAVASYTEIEIGRHGIVLQKAGRSAVFLPQVAPEQGWNLEETLSSLARKAGLPATGWQQGAAFEVFEAIVFAEQANDHP